MGIDQVVVDTVHDALGLRVKPVGRLEGAVFGALCASLVWGAVIAVLASTTLSQYK